MGCCWGDEHTSAKKARDERVDASRFKFVVYEYCQKFGRIHGGISTCHLLLSFIDLCENTHCLLPRVDEAREWIDKTYSDGVRSSTDYGGGNTKLRVGKGDMLTMYESAYVGTWRPHCGKIRDITTTERTEIIEWNYENTVNGIEYPYSVTSVFDKQSGLWVSNHFVYGPPPSDFPQTSPIYHHPPTPKTSGYNSTQEDEDRIKNAAGWAHANRQAQERAAEEQHRVQKQRAEAQSRDLLARQNYERQRLMTKRGY